MVFTYSRAASRAAISTSTAEELLPGVEEEGVSSFPQPVNTDRHITRTNNHAISFFIIIGSFSQV